MKIGLYFGSFNPIHNGHLIIASYVANHTDIQQIWLVVSPQNPLKPSSVLLSEYNRLHLVQIATEDDPQLRASEVEFKLPRPSYTIDTLTYLEEKYPHHEFLIVMGSDSFQNLSKWKNYKILLEKYTIIIYQRAGKEVTGVLPLNTTIIKAPLLEISATSIRRDIKEGRSIRYLVPEKVREEIEMAGYYKLSKEK
jgi:nicotinate-nucleotide adenylyltransferase